MTFVSSISFAELLDYRFDAECYRADLQQVEARVAGLKPRPLVTVATVSDGNHISISKYFCESGVRYLKGGELSDVFVDDAEPTYIPYANYAKMTRAHIAAGDVLLSVIGSVGPVALITDKYDRLSCTCKLAILRPYAIDGALLTAYLLSPTGQALLLRRNRGSGQQGVVLPDVRALPVPTFSDTLAERVGRVMAEAAVEARRGDALYPEAEAELLDRLGWAELLGKPVELSYVRDLADIATASRADAEFFQPQYGRLHAHLIDRGAQMIRAFCPKPSRGVQPLLVEGGVVVVVDSKAVRPQGIEPSPAERTTQAFYDSTRNAKGRIRRGDVLLNSTGRGTIGRAACFQLAVPAVCDNHVTILRPDATVCRPVYLALFLNSPAGLAQSERFQSGSSGQIEIYPEHIQQFLIYLPCQKNGAVDLGWQDRLATRVASAATAKAVARAKLKEATRMVEECLNVEATTY